MTFSIMRSKPEFPELSFKKLPQLGAPWIFGTILDSPPQQALEYHLVDDYEDPLYPMYELDHPLIRVDLLDALHKAGVNNLHTYEAVLFHPTLGEIRDQYVAFNVIGMIATSEQAASAMQHYLELEFETDEIDGIEPDYQAIPESMLLFRLADRMGRILVNQLIKEQLDFDLESGLVFFPTNDQGED